MLTVNKHRPPILKSDVLLTHLYLSCLCGTTVSPDFMLCSNQTKVTLTAATPSLSSELLHVEYVDIFSMHTNTAASLVLTPAGYSGRSEAARWSETDWQANMLSFQLLSLSNPSVTAVKWWNLSTVTLKRRKGRNDLINAGSSITNSVEQNLGEPCSHTVWSLHSPEITAAEHVSVMKLKHMLQMMKFIWH